VTEQKIGDLARFYYSELVNKGGTEPKKIDVNLVVTLETSGTRIIHDHLAWACKQVELYIGSYSQPELAQQWLGFIQGGMWMLGYFTIEEMRVHGVEKVEDPREED
jgi:hypothetical protein